MTDRTIAAIYPVFKQLRKRLLTLMKSADPRSIISANPEFGTSFRFSESRSDLFCHYIHCLCNLLTFCLYIVIS